MFIEDPSRSKAFYEKVFGVPAIYEDDVAVAFQFENLVVNLLQTGAAHELIEPATVRQPRCGLALPAHDRGRRRGCGVHGAHGQRRRLVERPDRPGMGHAHRGFRGSDGHVWELAAKISADE